MVVATIKAEAVVVKTVIRFFLFMPSIILAQNHFLSLSPSLGVTQIRVGITITKQPPPPPSPPPPTTARAFIFFTGRV